MYKGQVSSHRKSLIKSYEINLGGSGYFNLKPIQPKFI